MGAGFAPMDPLAQLGAALPISLDDLAQEVHVMGFGRAARHEDVPGQAPQARGHGRGCIAAELTLEIADNNVDRRIRRRLHAREGIDVKDRDRYFGYDSAPAIGAACSPVQRVPLRVSTARAPSNAAVSSTYDAR